MYIVVVGGGKVGYYLTKSLLEEGHEVLVIERDPRKCAVLTDEMSASVLQGDGCEISTLEEAGLGRADAVVAVTGDDEDNLVVCQVAKHRFNVARTIARLNNPKNEHIFRRLGIDLTVSSTDLILSQIEESIPSESLIHLLRLRGFGVSFVEADIPPCASVVGQPLRDLRIPADCLIALVVRDGTSTIVPSGDTVLEAGDRVIAVSSEASEAPLRSILCG
jgi:trk/ktr system potassium uptake protein